MKKKKFLSEKIPRAVQGTPVFYIVRFIFKGMYFSMNDR